MQSNHFFLRTSTNQFHSCQLLSSGQCMIKGCESRLINFDIFISILFSSLWLRDSTSSNWRMRKDNRRNIFVILFEVRFFVKKAKIKIFLEKKICKKRKNKIKKWLYYRCASFRPAAIATGVNCHFPVTSPTA